MPLIDTLSISASPENSSSAAEQEIFVDFQKLLLPEIFLVEYVSAEYLGRHSSGQIFQTFTCEATFDRSIVLTFISYAHS